MAVKPDPDDWSRTLPGRRGRSGRTIVIATFRNWSTTAGDLFGSLRSRPDRVRAGVEISLAALLVIEASLLVWIIARPEPELVSAQPLPIAVADTTIFARFDAFFRTGDLSSLAGATAADNSQMRLFGVRVGGLGGGSAIIGLADGRQMSVAVGDEVEPGLVVRSVDADSVTLARGQSLNRLTFSEIPVGAPPPPPPPPEPQVMGPGGAPASGGATAAALAVDPTQLMAQASLRPRMQGMSIKGFTVSGGGPALTAAGLQSGDVILAVNGNELTGLDRIALLRGQLANSPTAEIRFERAGQAQTTTIRTAR